MFRVNEADSGTGILTVKNGEMTVHIRLSGKKILNLYNGMAADAPSAADSWLKPVEEDVTYSDGSTETVFAFDVPVKNLDKEFDLALIGKKGVWYDHKVVVTLKDKMLR
ncbi:MAG: hypothetical protein J6P07_08760 [Spirochaetaceae bacterium]|nr:hypothetical protein [Spirochaetaceae bacterium]MBO7136778.1 hypothetical protein [Spirochaetaceae bacterium]